MKTKHTPAPWVIGQPQYPTTVQWSGENGFLHTTVKERFSGHKVGCWMPALSAAIIKAEGGAA